MIIIANLLLAFFNIFTLVLVVFELKNVKKLIIIHLKTTKINININVL